jgi:hypothetical protein
MNEFLIELDKFYQTYKLETKFELGFHKRKQKVQILKFIPKIPWVWTEFKIEMDFISINPKEKWKTSLFTQASLQPIATGAPWAKPSLPGLWLGLWPAHFYGHAQRAHGVRSPCVAAARAAPWRARHQLNDDGNPELFEGKRSPGDGLDMATWEPRKGGGEGVLTERVDGEEAPVRGWGSGWGGQRSGRGGAPWWHGTCEGVGGVRKELEEAAAGGVLTEEALWLLCATLCLCDRTLWLLVLIKCIYLPPTYLYFIQDIEDRCLLLAVSMSSVDLPFQEYRMMKKHHMDQNPCISLLCPK